VSRTREAVFAGSWYPGSETELRRFIEEATPSVPRSRAAVLVGPHAGFRFSGAIAAETYARVALPGTVVVLCPNHRVPPPVYAVWAEGAWKTPLGSSPVDEALCRELIALGKPLLRADYRPHEQEHAIELHLPFIQFHRPDAAIVPIVVATDSPGELAALGRTLARAVAGKDVLIVASTDMNHFESAEVGRRKDELALGRVLALDASGLFRVVEEEEVSMCGVRPTCVALHAARELGATRAELVRYGNSGEVSGDMDSVVGYAGVLVR
jgi:AmmeMemoRadiSam system protein B